MQESEGYKQKVIANAEGEASRFSQVLAEYQKAPVVTRQRIYLETMERILGNAEKLIYDGGNSSSGQSNIVPYLPLSELSAADAGKRGGRAAVQDREQRLELCAAWDGIHEANANANRDLRA